VRGVDCDKPLGDVPAFEACRCADSGLLLRPHLGLADVERCLEGAAIPRREVHHAGRRRARSLSLVGPFARGHVVALGDPCLAPEEVAEDTQVLRPASGEFLIEFQGLVVEAQRVREAALLEHLVAQASQDHGQPMSGGGISVTGVVPPRPHHVGGFPEQGGRAMGVAACGPRLGLDIRRN